MSDDADDKSGGDKLLTRAYVDIFSPAARQVGDRLARAAALALAPLDLLLWSAERVREFVSEDLPARLRARGVESDAIVSPPPQILGSVLAGLQVAGPDEPLREMFANLLASSMDARTAENAHPAHAEIIRQMTPDEARLFVHLYRTNGAVVARTPLGEEDGARPTRDVRQIIGMTTLAQRVGLFDVGRAPSQIENLERLGLVMGHSTPFEIRADESVTSEDVLTVTMFGMEFARACLAPALLDENDRPRATPPAE